MKNVCLIFLCGVLSACATNTPLNHSVDLYTQLARLYIEQGSYRLARLKLDDLHAIEPIPVAYYELSAWLAEKEQDKKAVLAFFREGLARYPRHAGLWNNYAVYLCEQGCRQASGVAFNEALRTATRLGIQEKILENQRRCAKRDVASHSSG